MDISQSGDIYYSVTMLDLTSFGGLKVFNSADGTGAHDWAIHFHASTNTFELENNGVALWEADTVGNLSLLSAGAGLKVKSGSNARIGVGAVLSGGTLTVSNTSVTANSVIIPIVTTLGTVTVAKALHVTKSAGASFTVTSADATDTSTFDWYIVEAI